jgi:hypothetical protein
MLGIWGRDALWSFRPAAVAQNFVELKLDARVFVFALILSLASSVVFALVPGVTRDARGSRRRPEGR